MVSTASSAPGTALVIGASGGLGTALLDGLRQRGGHRLVRGLSRTSAPPLDLTDEASIAAAAAAIAGECAAASAPLRLLLVASGFLHQGGEGPERSWSQLDAAYLRQVFEVNAIGPALLVKHFFPLLAREGAATAAFMSARVGSIGDNALGGWYGYRASKAALNQLVRTASIELTRRNRQSICVALHPGTVATGLSEPFAKTGLQVRPPEVAAGELLDVVTALTPPQTGGFLDYRGAPIPW